MKSLLLHICCGPCLPYVFRRLAQTYRVTGFFFNPNIQPEDEYQFRKNELDLLGEKIGCSMIWGEYHPEEWLEAVTGLESEPERGARCSVCFRMRLSRTFDLAKGNGFDMVATTLSISTHKNADQINIEGESLARRFGIGFLSANFKKENGAVINRKLGDEWGVRRQNYCGCLFSKR